jgi:4'-phosphopantetheinyl transferase
LPLNPGQVHLWFAVPEEIRSPELLEQYQRLLSEEENARRKRFRFERHGHRFAVTRALVRTTLSLYADVDPEKWRFVTNQYGKPEIEEAMNPEGIRFNVSHTRGLIVVALVLKHDVGVDVENTERRSDISRIADRFFSKPEVEDLQGLAEKNEAQARERFFHYWTLKESYIKACGKGLSMPLDRFSFHLEKERSEKDHPLEISFDSDLDDDPRQWQFTLMEALPGHPAALSVQRPPDSRHRIFTGKAIPLRSRAPFFCQVVGSSVEASFVAPLEMPLGRGLG